MTAPAQPPKEMARRRAVRSAAAILSLLPERWSLSGGPGGGNVAPAVPGLASKRRKPSPRHDHDETPSVGRNGPGTKQNGTTDQSGPARVLANHRPSEVRQASSNTGKAETAAEGGLRGGVDDILRQASEALFRKKHVADRSIVQPSEENRGKRPKRPKRLQRPKRPANNMAQAHPQNDATDGSPAPKLDGTTLAARARHVSSDWVKQQGNGSAQGNREKTTHDAKGKNTGGVPLPCGGQIASSGAATAVKGKVPPRGPDAAWTTSAPATWLGDHPFEADLGDHCETPLEAYQDIEPILAGLAKQIGKPKSSLRIYDPYFCEGSMKRHLASLGFDTVINENVDFYQAIADNTVPKYDVLVTNPPYSGHHVQSMLVSGDWGPRTLTEATHGRQPSESPLFLSLSLQPLGRGRPTHGSLCRVLVVAVGPRMAQKFCKRSRKPWLFLVPTYVHEKPYYRQYVHSPPTCYVLPARR